MFDFSKKWLLLLFLSFQSLSSLIAEVSNMQPKPLLPGRKMYLLDESYKELFDFLKMSYMCLLKPLKKEEIIRTQLAEMPAKWVILLFVRLIATCVYVAFCIALVVLMKLLVYTEFWFNHVFWLNLLCFYFNF